MHPRPAIINTDTRAACTQPIKQCSSCWDCRPQSMFAILLASARRFVSVYRNFNDARFRFRSTALPLFILCAFDLHCWSIAGPQHRTQLYIIEAVSMHAACVNGAVIFTVWVRTNALRSIGSLTPPHPHSACASAHTECRLAARVRARIRCPRTASAAHVITRRPQLSYRDASPSQSESIHTRP